jgi:hypothetical protein
MLASLAGAGAPSAREVLGRGLEALVLAHL